MGVRDRLHVVNTSKSEILANRKAGKVYASPQSQDQKL